MEKAIDIEKQKEGPYFLRKSKKGAIPFFWVSLLSNEVTEQLV